MTLPEIPKRKNDISYRTGLRRMIIVLSLLTAFVLLQGLIAAFFYNAFKPQNDLPTARLIYTVGNGGQARNLQTGQTTEFGGFHSLQMVSPDQNWLFKWEGNNNGTQVYEEAHLTIMDTKEWRTTDLGAFYNVTDSVSWSPDSQWIAFAAAESEEPEQILYNRDLWMINIYTKEIQRLTSNSLTEYDPAFSPDGTKVAFICRQEGTTDTALCVLNLQTRIARSLAPTGRLGALPAWSPDGRWIAYVNTGIDWYGDIWIVRADGTDAQAMTNTTMNDAFNQTESNPWWLP